MRMKKYFSIYKQLCKMNLMREMEYRFDFLLMSIAQLVYCIIKIMYSLIVYKTDTSIGGFSPNETMIFIGTYCLLTGFFVSFIMSNIFSLPHYVKTGELDSFIVKPISLQFYISTKNISLPYALTTLVVGIAMVGYGWYNSNVPLNLLNFFGYIALSLWGLFLSYSIFLIPNILSFWIISSGGVNQFVDQLWDFNNMPMFIYGKIIKFIGLFIIPIFLITNIPPLFILGKLSNSMLLWAIVAPIILFVISNKLFIYALKFYASASN